MAPPLTRIYAALVTPFTDSGTIDRDGLAHLVDYAAGLKLRGLALFTEAAEDAMLTARERKEILRAVSVNAHNRLRLEVHVSASATDEALELIELADAKGAERIVLEPRPLAGLGYRELYRYVDRIGRSTELPLSLSVASGSPVLRLEPEEVSTLLRHERLSSAFAPDIVPKTVPTWLRRAGSVAVGCSLSNGRAATLGAERVVCGMVLFASELSRTLQAAIAREDRSAVAKLEAQCAEAVEVLGPPAARKPDGLARLARRIAKRELEGRVNARCYPFHRLKGALKLAGHPISTNVRHPFEALQSDGLEDLRRVLKRAKILS